MKYLSLGRRKRIAGYAIQYVSSSGSGSAIGTKKWLGLRVDLRGLSRGRGLGRMRRRGCAVVSLGRYSVKNADPVV